MPWAEAKNLARSVRNGRLGKGAGNPERNQPCPMKPAQADSGNVRESRMTLSTEIAKFQIVKRNTMVALRVVFTNITCGVFCHSGFTKGVWRCPVEDVGDLNTPLLFCRAGVVVVKRLRGRKKVQDEYCLATCGS